MEKLDILMEIKIIQPIRSSMCKRFCWNYATKLPAKLKPLLRIGEKEKVNLKKLNGKKL